MTAALNAPAPGTRRRIHPQPGGEWDHVMTNRNTFAIRRDGTEVAMLSLVGDSVHESTIVREVVASFANAHGGTIGERSRAR